MPAYLCTRARRPSACIGRYASARQVSVLQPRIQGGPGPPAGSRSGGVAPEPLRAGPVLSQPAVPAQPGPRRPAQSIPKSSPPCSSRGAANFPPAGSDARQPGPALPGGNGVGSSYLSPRGLAEPPPTAGLAPALRPALLSLGRRRCSRSLPSRYPGNRLLLPPTNQPAPFTWRLTANGRPRHSGPLPGSRASSQAKGPDEDSGISGAAATGRCGPGGRRESSGPFVRTILLRDRCN